MIKIAISGKGGVGKDHTFRHTGTAFCKKRI